MGEDAKKAQVLTLIEAMIGQAEPVAGLFGEDESLLRPFKGIFARLLRILPLRIGEQIKDMMLSIAKTEVSL